MTAPLEDVVTLAWQSLCEVDDRTSPEEYPDMCLITQDELAGFMRDAALSSPSGGGPDREAVARIIDPFIFTPEALVSDEVDAENEEGRRIALTKADAILALYAQPLAVGHGSSAAPIPGEGPQAAVLVPREPTREMLEAAKAHGRRSAAWRQPCEDPRGFWAHMLAAAPKAAPANAVGTDDREAGGSAQKPLPETPVGWQDISTAPKDGRYIVALAGGADDRWEHLNGRAFVIRHEGPREFGYDPGWALYPGMGGVPDRWFTHWMDLPAPPVPAQPRVDGGHRP